MYSTRTTFFIEILSESKFCVPEEDRADFKIFINLPLRAQTADSCFSRVEMHSEVFTLHNLTKPSPEDVTICIPRDKNSALITEASWPSKV